MDGRAAARQCRAMPTPRPAPRLAVRGLLLIEGRLLLVNAWGGGQSDLLCPPGGGVEPHSSLPENLRREFLEETGLEVSVGAPCLVNEFHAPERGFHQVDVYFRVSLLSGDPFAPWTDPEGIVTERHLVARGEMHRYRYKPDSLPDVAWSDTILYDPLEPLVR
jgi:8-oxo-dGTP pyrophosphatase MutT (NUDIX family)